MDFTLIYEELLVRRLGSYQLLLHFDPRRIVEDLQASPRLCFSPFTHLLFLCPFCFHICLKASPYLCPCPCPTPLTFLLSVCPFWAADPKGMMSYRTEGGMSVRPSK